LILTSCQDKKLKKVMNDFSVTTTFEGSYQIDTSEIVYIVGKLHNRSADTLSFLSMTCSWDDSWKMSSPNLRIEKNICYSNVPMLIKLGPNESMLNYIPVRLLKPLQEIRDEKFQVGFNLVKADTVEFSKSIKALEETNNYQWGDTMQLNMLYRLNTIKKEN
jgi:hypothetical protein